MTRGQTRPGTILPALALCLVALFSFVALAVDIGMLAVARTDCQNAADVAALAGARMLNNKPGVADSNRPAAIAQAKAAATGNYRPGSNFTAAEVQSVIAGQYNYDTGTQQFAVSYPAALGAGQSWTAMQVVLSTAQPTYFMRVMGVNSMPSGARAVAVHRPRDIALVIDMTGSMGYGTISRLDTNPFLTGGVGKGVNDPNTMWPQFSHYQRYTAYPTNNPTGSETGSVGSRPNPFQQMKSIVDNTNGYVYAPANLTIETPNGKPIVRDFYFDPSNLASPATPVTSTDGTNFRNAFHQWSPAESGADPANYVGPTYDFTGYNVLDTTGASGALPAPDNFKNQSDSPVAYAGDKSPRKAGYVDTAGTTTWDPTNSKGAAVTAAEYLGWVKPYSGGSSLPTTMGTMTGGSFTSRTPAGRTWTNFRDLTWETYGYDMDVADYIANRGATWDPRGSGSPAQPLTKNTSGGVPGQVKVTAGKFKGYSMGPGYFGKTFFVWPPDPRTPVNDPGQSGYVPGDWRQRYFLNRSGSALTTQGDNDSSTGGTQNVDQELLTNGTGATLTSSSGNWQVNYPAVLKWLKSGPMVLPPNLRSGRVLYYSSIPDGVTASGSDSADAKADKVFWKGYIDYVLSTANDYVLDVGGAYTTTGNLAGPEPKGWPEGVTPAVGSTAAYNSDPLPYLNYTDNPSRPRLHFWFGPLTMMMYLGNYNYWSGTTHQAQSWQLKAGVNSALDDIRNNHPNDYVGMAFFTTPNYNSVVVPIGRDYTTLKNSLFFPQNQLTNILTDPTAEWRPYTSAGVGYNAGGNIPNAQRSTDPVTGMALAYNILSPSPNVNADPTRRGRRGAAKMVIFETDGIPNATQPFNLQKAGYNSYYTYGGSTPNSSPSGAAIDVVTQICKPVATNTTTGVSSGFSLPNAPARVYAIGFGDIFSTTVGPTAAAFLLQVQQAGGTSAATDSSIPSYQIITGTYQDRIANLRTGLERIFQSGVQVTLVE